jgi:hypothetical protein
MRSRSVYAIVGLFVGALVSLLLSFLSAIIRQQTFFTQFSNNPDSIIWLIILIVAGLLIGYWLGGPVKVPATVTSTSEKLPTGKSVTITRFRALLSYGKLRGQGIHLSDILIIGSRLDIDTKD